MVRFVRTVLGEKEARGTEDALTAELTACPAVETSGEGNPKYKALIKTDRRGCGFLPHAKTVKLCVMMPHLYAYRRNCTVS